MSKTILLVVLLLLSGELDAQVATAPTEVHGPVVSGFFYPRDPDKLKEMVNRLIEAAPEKGIPGRPVALISPHAGYDYSGGVAAYGYKTLQGKGYKRVIILAPSHYGKRYRGASILKASYYQTPLGQVEIDKEVCNQLTERPPYFGHDALFGYYAGAYKNEHSLETQLPFLQTVLGNFKLVPILLGLLMEDDFQKIADALRPYVDDDTLVVASSDFTHYGDRFGYVPFRSNIEENLKKLDLGAIERILVLDFDGFNKYREDTGITVCGFYPIAVLLKLLPKEAQGNMLTYDTSGRMANDFNHSVSYTSIVFTTPGKKTGKAATGVQSAECGMRNGEYGMRNAECGVRNNFASRTLNPPFRTPHSQSYPSPLLLVGGNPPAPGEPTAEEGQLLLSLARTTLEGYTRNHYLPEVQETTLSPRLKEKCGVFVTLHKNGELRGCIGHILPKSPLWQAVIENAVSSAFRDSRFPPLREEELKEVDLEVSVLSPLRRISGPEEFQVGKEGILIKLGNYSGVFLPQVAREQGWDREETLCHLCRKAGLPWHAWWNKEMEFYVFTTTIFKENTPVHFHAGSGR
jgi:AmmeMemoRadiSam system protein B/AmmeMemoRadiSam system protein A